MKKYQELYECLTDNEIKRFLSLMKAADWFERGVIPPWVSEIYWVLDEREWEKSIYIQDRSEIKYRSRGQWESWKERLSEEHRAIWESIINDNYLDPMGVFLRRVIAPPTKEEFNEEWSHVFSITDAAIHLTWEMGALERELEKSEAAVRELLSIKLSYPS